MSGIERSSSTPSGSASPTISTPSRPVPASPTTSSSGSSSSAIRTRRRSSLTSSTRKTLIFRPSEVISPRRLLGLRWLLGGRGGVAPQHARSDVLFLEQARDELLRLTQRLSQLLLALYRGPALEGELGHHQALHDVVVDLEGVHAAELGAL